VNCEQTGRHNVVANVTVFYHRSKWFKL